MRTAHSEMDKSTKAWSFDFKTVSPQVLWPGGRASNGVMRRFFFIINETRSRVVKAA
jgi:hypothetical protein